MMNNPQCRLLRRLLTVAPKRRLDRGTISIFRFYERMRDHPTLQPEEFPGRFPDDPAYYPVVQLFAVRLEARNSMLIMSLRTRRPRFLGKSWGTAIIEYSIVSPMATWAKCMPRGQRMPKRMTW